MEKTNNKPDVQHSATLTRFFNVFFIALIVGLIILVITLIPLKIYNDNFKSAKDILSDRDYEHGDALYQEASKKLQSVINHIVFGHHRQDAYFGLLILTARNYTDTGDDEEMNRILDEIMEKPFKPEFKQNARYNAAAAQYERVLKLHAGGNAEHDMINAIIKEARNEIYDLDYFGYQNPEMYIIWSSLFQLAGEYEPDKAMKEEYKEGELTILENGYYNFPLDLGIMIKLSYVLYERWSERIDKPEAIRDRIQKLNSDITNGYDTGEDTVKEAVYEEYIDWYDREFK